MTDDRKPGLYLCIDGGGTKTSVTIAGRRHGADGGAANIPPTVLATGSHRSSNYTDLGLDFAVLAIGEATVQALRSLPAEYASVRDWTFEGYKDKGRSLEPAPFSKIWAGLSGVDSDRDVAVMQAALARLFGLSPSDDPGMVEVTNDCDLLSSAIEARCRSTKTEAEKVCRGGVVLIAGTGSVATAFKPNPNSPEGSHFLRAVGRLGGYGYLLGDEGSAFYVGRETVKTILASLDHGKQTDSVVQGSTLLQEVLRHFNIQDPAGLLAAVYSLDKSIGQTEHDRKVRLAEVSRVVMGCAFPKIGEGDQFARRIMRKTAEKLSDLVSELCELHSLAPDEMALCLGGGMWGYEAFKAMMLDICQERWGAKWGWVQTIQNPDQLGALVLAGR